MMGMARDYLRFTDAFRDELSLFPSITLSLSLSLSLPLSFSLSLPSLSLNDDQEGRKTAFVVTAPRGEVGS